MGRDLLLTHNRQCEILFQSTRPAWGETGETMAAAFSKLFQSTRPAWGETEALNVQLPTEFHFNPLAPHGARLGRKRRVICSFTISIHSPRMGRDLSFGSFAWSPL